MLEKDNRKKIQTVRGEGKRRWENLTKLGRVLVRVYSSELYRQNSMYLLHGSDGAAHTIYIFVNSLILYTAIHRLGQII